MTKATAIFVSLLGLICPAHAQSEDKSEEVLPMYLSAGGLLNDCAASSLTSLGRERRRFCAGFISGVEESMRLAQETSQNVGSDVICAPPNVSARQLAEAYVRYANQARERLGRPAAEMVVQALRDTYPCQEANRP